MNTKILFNFIVLTGEERYNKLKKINTFVSMITMAKIYFKIENNNNLNYITIFIEQAIDDLIFCVNIYLIYIIWLILPSILLFIFVKIFKVKKIEIKGNLLKNYNLIKLYIALLFVLYLLVFSKELYDILYLVLNNTPHNLKKSNLDKNFCDANLKAIKTDSYVIYHNKKYFFTKISEDYILIDKSKEVSTSKEIIYLKNISKEDLKIFI